jgi:PhzF family phenazine biosynthesis protein
MQIPIYQVDAFASRLFAGNPAAVCVLESWIDDALLQSIAAENNLSETAFLVRKGAGFELRWFTPTTEIALCGHATLASAFVLFNRRQWTCDPIRFQTRKSGELAVGRRGDLFELDFPALPVHPRDTPAGLCGALGVVPQAVLGSTEDVLVVLDSEEAVARVRPDFHLLGQVACRGVVVTARGTRSDFVSRFFAPRVGIPEDPVTGSAHCALVPYWAGVLRRDRLHALQISPRGGELFCVNEGARVKIAGRAVLYLEGTLTL